MARNQDGGFLGDNARHVDRKVIWVWMAPTAIALFIIWLLCSLAYLFMPADVTILGLHKMVFPMALFFLIAAAAGIPLYAWFYLTYDRLTFELAENDLVLREGVLTRKSTVIPYEKIEDLSSERTLFERMLGLATIEVETAGRSHPGSEMVIPGISNKDELISELLMIVNAKKAKAPSEPGKPSSEQLLADILKELKTLSSKFDTFVSKAGGQREAGISGADAFKNFRRK